MTDNQEFLNQVVITPNQPLSVHLRQLILRRIWFGIYPVRQLLPSTRALAKELGVNRNTVSKVYRELQQEGWLAGMPGKGVMVIRRSGPGGAVSTREAIALQLNELVGEAQTAGLSPGELGNLFEASLATHYKGRVLNLAFVECNERDTVQLSEELAIAASMPVRPVVISELQERAQVYAGYDLVTTTFYHFGEVEEAFRPFEYAGQVIAIQVNPVPELLLEVARLAPGKRVCIIARNLRTARSINHILQMYNHTLDVAKVIVEEDIRELDARIQWAEIIVDSQSSHDFVLAHAPGKRTLTVRFQIDQQSIDFFLDQITEHLKDHAEIDIAHPVPAQA